MGHFYLPDLESNIAVPKDKAHWFNNDKKILLGISEGIVIDEKSKTRGISSIPDIWARPLLFQSALRENSKHPLKEKCIQEWRGLLSLLALHRIKPELANFEIVSINLDSDKFSSALKNLCPDSVQLEQETKYSWTHILMARFNGIPLGAFSPTTLVFTGADYNKKLAGITFPFKDENGYLAPPKTKKDGVEYVGEWLYHLQQRLNQVFYTEGDDKTKSIIGNINKLIKDWLGDIRNELNLKDNNPIDVSNYKVSEERIDDIKGTHPFLDSYKIYCDLLRPLVKEDAGFDEKSIFDVLLRSTRNKELRTVVITEKILSEQANIWENYQTKSLGDNPKEILKKYFNAPSGKTIDIVNIGEQNGLWIRPEVFFLSNVLIKSKGNNNILNEEEGFLNVTSKYILPFKKEILEFFSPRDIKENLNLNYYEDSGVVTFSFNLPVGNKLIKIDKKYRNKAIQETDGIILEVDAPIVEIFPNYLGEDWLKYYLFQGMAENYYVTPLLIDSQSAKTSIREREYIDETDYQKVRLFEIAGKNSFPEAIEINQNTKEPIGIILLSKKDKNQGLKNSWKVGIDFGTSNTNVFKKSLSAEQAERWIYNFPEYYRTITLCDPTSRSKILEKLFFPTRQITLPIPTTLKIFNLAKKDSMVLDYFIFFPIEYKFPEDVITDIKWNDDGERKTEYFFESLLFLLFIEIVNNGVGEVKIACSYPKAFTDDNIQTFKKEWNNVINKLVSANNSSQQILVTHSGNAQDNEFKVTVKLPAAFKTEGVAAGEYFASPETITNINDRADKEIAAICLDAGGGTTDISIWYQNNIEYDSSVLLAGRQISNLLQKNSRVRELLFTKEAAIALDEKKNEPGYFSARLNLILKNEEQHIENMLIKHSNSKDIQWLRQIIALEFCALSFFAAQVCILTEEKVNGLLDRIAYDGIKLHWGGNAAKLINWIDSSVKHVSDGRASKILNAIFFNCLNDKTLGERAVKAKSLLQLQSPGHKSEASGGLVVMDLESKINDSVKDNHSMAELEMPDSESINETFDRGIICAENIELTDRTIKFYESVSKKDFFNDNNKTKFESTSLDRLIRFIEILNFFGLKNGLFTEDTKIIISETEKRIIKDGVLKEFIRMQSVDADKRLVEPIFITEIKILLDIIQSKIN